MDLYSVILLIGGLVVLGGGILTLPRVWGNRMARGGEHAPPWWGWGEALWQGYRRIMPLNILGVAVFLAAFVFLSLLPKTSYGPFARPTWAVLTVFGTLGLVLVAMLGVVLWNRPRFVVPPHLRDQRGAAAEWLVRLKRSGRGPTDPS